MDIVSYAMGEGAGYKKGYAIGEDAGYEKGYADGQDSDAYTEGYDTGYSEGFTSGYDTGFPAGVASVNSVKDLIDARGAVHLFDVDTGAERLTNEKLSNIIKYDDTKDISNTSYMFRGQQNLSIIPSINTENVVNMSYMFSGGCFASNSVPPELNTSKVENISNMFNGYSNNGYNNSMISLPLYDFRSVTNATGLFAYCRHLRSIPALNFENMGTRGGFQEPFWLSNTNMLEEIHIIDIHYYFNISASTNFTREALLEIIGNLRDMTGSTPLTLTLGATNLAKLTEEDIALATEKNWTVA